jgi:hypothetical protein
LGFDASRREVIAASGLAAAGALLPGRLLAAAAEDRAMLARDAVIWSVPLILTGRYLDIARDAGVPLNRLVLSPDLATPATRALGAQVDTLYGLGWLDLADGPLVIEVPDTHDRYYAIQLIDAWGNSFAYIGRRATGTKASAWAITPPGYAGSLPPDMHELRAPTSVVLAFVRTLVRGAADLPAARRIHGAYRLGPLADYPRGQQAPLFRSESLNILPIIDFSTVGASWFAELNALLARFPPLPFDQPSLARFGDVWVAPWRVIPADPTVRTMLAAAVQDGLALARQPGPMWTANGWSTRPDVVPFIRDPLLRARVNIFGAGMNIAEEALYFTASHGPDGAVLSGEKRYRIRFPAGRLPPVDAFWSIGIYDERFFMFDNPIQRYSLTDRTEGLRYGADGSLDVLIQHDQPAEGPSNWLPAPPDRFSLTLRAYQPKPALLLRRYQLPPIELVSPASDPIR